MKENTKLKLVFLLFIMFCGTSFAQGNAKFKVVLDPGHGGKDFGAIYHGFVEKNIALNVALKVGKLLEQDDNIQVIYTRKTDVFTELAERPNIANKADADIFISLHCNGEVKKAAFGTETFVMGPTKNASNLEVARAENNVVTLEKDYKVKYEGFDPSKPESLTATLQEPVLSNSIDMASKIQDVFTNTVKRKNRGVKYAPIWALQKLAMPGILIELGFISYEQEGAFLNSENGQDDMAKAIAKAIQSYKKEHYTGSGQDKPVATTVTPRQQPSETKPVETNTSAATASAEPGIVFKVQISASSRSLETVPENFKGLNNITKDSSTAVIKYFYGAADTYAEAKELLETAKEKGYTSAFVVAFKDGKKITVQEALKK